MCATKLMAFKIIKCLFAGEATVHGLTGRGAKLADNFGMVRLALRALDCLVAKHVRYTELLFGIGWRNAKSL